MKGLMENECGGQNPLMKLTTHFTNTSGHLRTQDASRSRQQANVNPTADMFISEYLGIDQKVPHQQQQPRTFQMGRLLNEIKQIDSSSIDNKAVCQPRSHMANKLSLPVDSDWNQEYFSLNNMLLKQSPLIYEDRAFQWSADYLTQSEATIFNEAWGDVLTRSSIMAGDYLMPSISEDRSSELTTTINNNQLNEEMRKTANELLDTMQDSRFSETEFLSFVRNLSQNNNNTQSNGGNNQTNSLNDTLDDSTYTELGNGSVGLNEDECAGQNEADLSTEWVREFQSIGSGGGQSLVDEPVGGTFWNDLQEEWNVAAS